MSNSTTTPKTIFATGVELQAVECIINGIKQYRWVAINFEDESFYNGTAINPTEYADFEKDLIKQF